MPVKSLAQPNNSASFDTFYDDLAPYGRWVNDPNYGSVWLPNVPSDFQPYATDGHWVLTEYGNTWVSDYPWGWAAFHYGRWFYQDYYGWTWVPGDEWGPAWVSWRSGGEYYGWAPLAPGYNVNVVLNIPSWQWVFVPQIYITSPRIYSYCVPRTRIVHIYSNSMPCDNGYRNNNHLYAYGPHRHDMERVTRSRMQVYRIDHMNRPGRAEMRDGSMHMYRPEVVGHWNNNRGTHYSAGQGRDNSGNRGYASDNRTNLSYREDRRGNNYADQPNRNRSSQDSQGGNSPQNRDNNTQWNNNRGGQQQPGRRFEQPERQAQPTQQWSRGGVSERATPVNQQERQNQPAHQPRQQQAPQQPAQTQPSPRQESPRGGQSNPGQGRRGPR